MSSDAKFVLGDLLLYDLTTKATTYSCQATPHIFYIYIHQDTK